MSIYNKYNRINELHGKVQRLEDELGRETDPAKRLFLEAEIKNTRKQISHIK